MEKKRGLRESVIESFVMRFLTREIQSRVARGLHGQEDQSIISELLRDLLKTGDANVTDRNVVDLIRDIKKTQRQGQLVPSNDREAPVLQPWMTSKLAGHYIRFAAAVYGASHIYGMKGPEAVANIIATKAEDIWRYFLKDLPAANIADTSMANTNIFKQLTGLKQDDLIYVTYDQKDEFYMIPFVVCLDHTEKAVVVVLRGTISENDWLIDVSMVGSEELPSEQFGGVEGIRVHRGMLRTAEVIRKRLLDGDIDKVYKEYECGLLSLAWSKLNPEQAKEYKLVITGHSLGAGVAAILALLLRQTAQYSDLKCFAFSPPGCLLSAPASDYTTGFVYSVVLGDDLVGRTSIHTLFDMKIKVLKDLRTHPEKAAMFKFDDPEEFKRCVTELIDSGEKALEKHHRLYLPGCIMYLQEIVNKSVLGVVPTDAKYVAYQSCSREDAILSEILLSRNIIRHHVPWLVMKALDYVNTKK